MPAQNTNMYARNEDTQIPDTCETTDDHRLKVDALISGLISSAEWEIALISDETANDNDKTIVVPAGYEYQVLWIWVELVTDATQGNRQIEIMLRDPTNDQIGDFRAGATQAASLTRYYMFAPALADLTAFRDTDYLMSPLPPTIFLPAGYRVRVFDNNNISAADDMIIQMMVARRAT